MSITVKYKFGRQLLDQAKKPKSSQLPSRAARMLALAYYIERLIESGELKDYADAARKLGLTRARISQVMDLLVLSPTIQEAILSGKAVGSERQSRRLVRHVDWKLQNSLLPL